MSSPVNDLDAVAFVNVPEAVHPWFDSTDSPEEVIASHTALGAPVEDPFEGSMRHDDINGIRDRVRGDRGRSIRDVAWIVESVFVVLVCERPVTEGRRVRGDVDCESGSAFQRERVRSFIQKRDPCFVCERPSHGFDR